MAVLRTVLNAGLRALLMAVPNATLKTTVLRAARLEGRPVDRLKAVMKSILKATFLKAVLRESS